MQTKLGRKLNSLEVLVLVFVKSGLTSAYDLVSQAGMSASLAGPAMKRMEVAGLLIGTPGPRNAMRYAITEAGENVLRDSLQSRRANDWFPERHSIFESGPRSVLLACLYSGPNKAINCVDWAIEELRLQSHKKEREAKDLLETLHRRRKKFLKDKSASDEGILIATAYRWLKATLDASLFKMQADAMGEIVPLIWELPSAPQTMPRDEQEME